MIIKGDAYKLIKSIEDKSVDLIITDPPYLIEGIHGSGVYKGRTKGTHYTYELQEKALDKSIDFSILDEFVRVLKRIYIYMV